jgi:D-alanyl-D-alanine endopeptidase (penicillin-binding protein 7)
MIPCRDAFGLLLALSLALPLGTLRAAERVAASYAPAGNGVAAEALLLDLSGAVSPGQLHLRSSSVLVVDQKNGRALVSGHPETVTPIASITKLMTAMVVLDSQAPLDELITITDKSIDTIKGTRSRLHVGVALPRRELMHLALMSSENRAASALAHAHPEGFVAFVAAMNRKAAELGMQHTHFIDSTGLSSENVSTAGDLVQMVRAAYQYAPIREFTTAESHEVEPVGARRALAFRNSNGLVRSKNWAIGLSKTGYIAEAGRCLVMQAQIAAKPVIIVLLDSWGKNTRMADANRIKRWLESSLTGRRLG